MKSRPHRKPPQSTMMSGKDLIQMLHDYVSLEEFDSLIVDAAKTRLGYPLETEISDIHPAVQKILSNQILYEMQVRAGRSFV